MSNPSTRRDLLVGLGAALLMPSAGFAQTAGPTELGETVAERTACLLTIIAEHSLDLGLYFAQKFAGLNLTSVRPMSEQFIENNHEWGDSLVQAVAKGSIALTPAATQDLAQLTLANDQQKKAARYPVLPTFRIIGPDPDEDEALAEVFKVTKSLAIAGLSFTEPQADRKITAFAYYCGLAGVKISLQNQIYQDKGFMRRFGDYAGQLRDTRRALVRVVEAGTGQCGALLEDLADNVQAIRGDVAEATRYANEKRYTDRLDVRYLPELADPGIRRVWGCEL